MAKKPSDRRRYSKKDYGTGKRPVSRTSVRISDIGREAVAYSLIFTDRDPISGGLISVILEQFTEYLKQKILDGSRVGFGFPDEIADRLHDGFPHVSPSGKASAVEMADALRHIDRSESPLRLAGAEGILPPIPISPQRDTPPTDRPDNPQLP